MKVKLIILLLFVVQAICDCNQVVVESPFESLQIKNNQEYVIEVLPPQTYEMLFVQPLSAVMQTTRLNDRSFLITSLPDDGGAQNLSIH